MDLTQNFLKLPRGRIGNDQLRQRFLTNNSRLQLFQTVTAFAFMMIFPWSTFAQRELVRLGKKVMRSGKTANTAMPATMIHTKGQEAR
jgi:hypothetical protein